MSFYSVRRGKREMIADLPEEHVTADHIGHSTLEYTTPDGRRVIRFHRTNVVTFHPNGDITLDSGGHQSNTTKKRFNEHAPVDVYQHQHEWYVQTRGGIVYPFHDGFTVDSRGVPTNETFAQLVVDGDMTITYLLNFDAARASVTAAQSIPEVIDALAALSEADPQTYRQAQSQALSGRPKVLSQEEWDETKVIAADPRHPEYQEVASFATRVQFAFGNLRPNALEVLVILALNGQLTREQLLALPPKMQVAIDVELEKLQ